MTKRIFALLISVALIIITFAGCHEKGETVMTIDGYAIPSGLYLAVQMDAYNQFVSEVKNQVGSSYTIKSLDEYMKFTLDGVSATDWINNTTLTTLKQYVAVERRFEDAGLEFTSDDQSYADYYANYYWENYKLADVYELNGISKTSYSLIWANYVKKNDVFLYNYDAPNETTGKGGVLQVSDSDLVSTLGENYVLANRISISTNSSQTDENGSKIALTADEIAAIKTKLEGYAERINKGTSFDTVKAEYDAETASDSSASSTASNVTTDSSADKSTSIYPASATAYSSQDSDKTNYTSIKSLISSADFSYGKAIVTDDSANGNYYLTVVYDISLDPYYLDYYHTSLLYLLKQDEFDGLIDSDSKDYVIDTNKSLVSFYSPTKIKSTD